jgi:hypothetical protein
MTIAARPKCDLLVNRQRKTVVAGLDPAIHGPGEVEMALGEVAMMKGSLPAGRPTGRYRTVFCVFGAWMAG